MDHLSSLEYDPAVTLALTVLKAERFASISSSLRMA